MKVSLDEGLKVLLASVEHHDADSSKKYLVFTRYFGKCGQGSSVADVHLSAGNVQIFHKELQAVLGVLSELEIGLSEEGAFIPVEKLGRYNAENAIKIFLDFHIERCRDAIAFGSGFGKHANNSFCYVRFVAGKGAERSNFFSGSDNYDFTY